MKYMKYVALAILIASFECHAAESSGSMQTQWRVTPAAGMDALLLLGAASGDVMQAQIYGDSITWVRENMTPDGLDALDTLDVNLRQRGRLVGPSLAYFFSAGPVATIDDVIASAADPVGRLKAGLQTSPHWDLQEFEIAVSMMPVVHSALTALRDAGFSRWYESIYLEELAAAIEANMAAVENHDIIPEQARLLGRPLSPEIEIIIVAFARPYGIRIMGQRFVAYYGWEAETQLRIAAHEIFHPPFDPNDEDLAELLAELENDEWMQSIVQNHDPKYGYNSFMGVVNEGSTQALDQVVSERLGFAENPGARWQESDGGMHMLAAALYQAMVEDGFADTGSNYSSWFKDALRQGTLDPASVRERATIIVGPETVEQWYDPDVVREPPPHP